MRLLRASRQRQFFIRTVVELRASPRIHPIFATSTDRWIPGISIWIDEGLLLNAQDISPKIVEDDVQSLIVLFAGT